MKALLFALSFFLLAFRSPAQVQGLKEQALESFRRERYDEAVALMERAAEADPTDAESWYYLGFFNHYRAYDSRPLKGYDLSYSERVFLLSGPGAGARSVVGRRPLFLRSRVQRERVPCDARARSGAVEALL